MTESNINNCCYDFFEIVQLLGRLGYIVIQRVNSCFQTTPFTFGLTYEQVFGNGTVFSAMSGANQSNEATRTNLDQYLSMLNSEPFDNKM